MAAPMTMGKVGKGGKAVLMKKTNNLQVVKDHYCQPPAPGELLVHNVYTSVNPVDCYMRSGVFKVQFFPKVRGRDSPCRGFGGLTRASWPTGSGQRRRGPGGAGA
jgi:hypothetical protein